MDELGVVIGEISTTAEEEEFHHECCEHQQAALDQDPPPSQRSVELGDGGDPPLEDEQPGA